MPARTKARKRALDVLYEAELKGEPAGSVLAQRPEEFPAYARDLVEGVLAHHELIDRVLSQYAADWTLDRMPAVDRNILRIAVWELLFNDDVPSAVTMSEAVALATDLSTARSPSFVNGLLARVAADRDRLLP